MLGKFKSINLLKRVFSFPRHFCVYFPLFCSPKKVFCFAWQSEKTGKWHKKKDAKRMQNQNFLVGKKHLKTVEGGLTQKMLF